MSAPHPVTILPHPPETDAGKTALARRVAAIHADGILRRLQGMSCSGEEKQAQLREILRTVQSSERERT